MTGYRAAHVNGANAGPRKRSATKHASARALQVAGGEPVLIRPGIASAKHIALTTKIATISA
jgi:hypothetical protein